MFNVGGGEIIVILLLALLVLGPDKLPSTAKKVGRFLHEVRRMTSGFEQEVRQALDFESLSGVHETQTASERPTAEDAIHRTNEGPTLTAAAGSTSSPSAGPDTAPTGPQPRTSPAGSAAFVADLSQPRTVDDGD